jgi:proprotein convertase subtilisin/kexin type 5
MGYLHASRNIHFVTGATIVGTGTNSHVGNVISVYSPLISGGQYTSLKKAVFGVNAVAIDSWYNIIYYTVIKCSTGLLSLTRNSCISSCPPQATSSNGRCGCPLNLNQANCLTACPYRCAACTEFTAGTVSCALCSGLNKRVWADVDEGSCLCFSHYYDDGISPACQACNSTCLTCSNPTTCLSCYPSIRTLVNTECKCITGISFGSACLPCDTACRTCSGPYANNCLSCDTTRTLASNTCLCNTRAYPVVGLKNCVQCQIYCLTCSNAISCTSCEENRVIDSKQTCVCKVGYFDDSVTINCTRCSIAPYFCQSCLFSTCLTCSP